MLQDGDPDLIRRCRSTGPTWALGVEASRPARRHIWRRLDQIITEFEPDIVHARSTAAWFDATFALRHHPRVRLVLGFHGRTSLDPPDWLRRRINRWTCRRADIVLAVSCEAARMLENEWDVPARKIRVIPNGVDTNRFRPPQGRCGDSPELPARRPADHVVACVANLHPIKNIDTLLRNWRRVAMADPRAKLWIIGDGPMRDALVKLSAELRIAETVEFLGRRDDIPELLRAADLFVLPSGYEGSSNASMEAMATGLPVIAFDVGGMSELVRPNHTGWLVPPDHPDRLADVILAALIDRSARQRAGQTARRAIVAEQVSISLRRWSNPGESGDIPAGAQEHTEVLTDYDKKNGYSRKAYYTLGEVRIGERGWWTTGKMAYESPMRHGRKHGLFRGWYSDGKLWQERFFRNGDLHGLVRQWNEHGDLSVSFWLDGRNVTREAYDQECELDPALPRIREAASQPASQPAGSVEPENNSLRAKP